MLLQYRIIILLITLDSDLIGAHRFIQYKGLGVSEITIVMHVHIMIIVTRTCKSNYFADK